MDRASVARFLLPALLWGSSFTFIEVSLEGLTPGQLVLGRLLLGAAVLLSIVAVRRVAVPVLAGVAYAENRLGRSRRSEGAAR